MTAKKASLRPCPKCLRDMPAFNAARGLHCEVCKLTDERDALLEALKLALFALEGSSREDDGRQHTLQTIRAAIAKAEGKGT